MDVVASLVCKDFYQKNFGGISSISAFPANLLQVCIISVMIVFMLFSIPSMYEIVIFRLFDVLVMF